VSDPATGLARILAAGAAQQRRQDRQPYGVRMITGTVTTWDAVSGHVVNIAGTNVVGVQVLGTASFSPGDVVTLLQYKSSLLILGSTGSAGTPLPSAAVATVFPSGDSAGTTDAAAINLALASGTGTVTLTPGTYWISSPITVPDYASLSGPCRDMGIPTGNYGAGPLALAGTIIRATAGFTGTAMIKLGSAGTTQHGGQQLRGLTLDGEDLPNGNTVHGIYSQGYVAGVTLRDILVWGGYHAGTGGLGGDGLHAANDGTSGHNPDFWDTAFCKFSDCGGWGVNVTGLADSWWTACESTGNGTGGGWSITEGADSRWTACRGDSNGSVPGWSITVTGSANMQFANCEANLNGTGWVFAGSGSGNIHLTGCKGSGNTTALVSYSGTNAVRTSGGNFTVWIPLTFSSAPAVPWTNSGTGPHAAYRWEGSQLEVIGDMTAGTLTAGTAVFTLPSVAHAQTLALQDETTRSALAQLNVGTGGSVTFFQGIGTVASGDRCFVHGFVSTDA